MDCAVEFVSQNLGMSSISLNFKTVKISHILERLRESQGDTWHKEGGGGGGGE